MRNRTTKFAAILTLAGLFAVAGGCGDNASTTDGPAKQSAAGLEVKVMSLKQIQETIAAKKGKVVVVDYWSTYCEPCKKEFPGLVALSQKHADDVACISVSVDFSGAKGKKPEDKLPAVKEFLASQHATKVENILASEGSDDVMKAVTQVKPQAAPAPPAVFVFARDGSLAHLFENSQVTSDKDNFTYADVAKLVEELIAKK
jgi:thiol-disulfide isomerase/thioredoxin